jgi:predicted GNAT family acetyltransferase
MEIKHRINTGKGAFYFEANGAILAEMTYSMAGSDKFIIDHTEVSDQLRGQGVGQQLVAAAVHFARENQLKIIPLCPFASSVFKKQQEFHDVLI